MPLVYLINNVDLEYSYLLILELPWRPLKDNETIVLDGSDELTPTGRRFDIVDDLLAGCGRG